MHSKDLWVQALPRADERLRGDRPNSPSSLTQRREPERESVSFRGRQATTVACLCLKITNKHQTTATNNNTK